MFVNTELCETAGALPLTDALALPLTEGNASELALALALTVALATALALELCGGPEQNLRKKDCPSVTPVKSRGTAAA